MHRLALTAIVVALAARAARAQSVAAVAEGTIDLGGALLRQPGLAANGVLTAGAQWRYAGPEFAISTNGILARTPDDRYTGQGVFTASRYAVAGRRLRWELTGTGSAFGVSSIAPSFAWQGLAREYLGSSLGGAFVGAIAGQVAQSGISHGVFGAHAGGFVRLDPLGRDELSTIFAYTDAGAVPATPARTQYGDVIAYWTHHSTWLELSMGGGARGYSLRHGSSTQTWATGNAALWMTDRAALVSGVGRALADEARGVPSVRYFSFGLRVGTRASLPAMSLRVRRSRGDDAMGRLDICVVADSVRVVSVRMPTAAAIEIMADFTDWEIVPLTKLPNGDWTIERAIAPGPHRIAMRIDGGPWTVPPNLTRVADDFGGEVGLVIVP